MAAQFTIKRKSSTNEWVVVVYENNKRSEERCYYTDDKQDAIDTMVAMQFEEATNNSSTIDNQIH